MNKDTGWIKVHRKIQETTGYFAEPFCRNMAWIDLLLLANHEDNFFRYRGIRVDVKRGQTGIGIEKFCYRWKWSRNKVERFMQELEKDEKIVRQKNNITTLITIINYNQYQEKVTQAVKQEVTQIVKQEETQTDTNKNDKNDKNDIKKDTVGGFSNYFPKKEEFNGLPETYFENLYRMIRATKNIEIDRERVDSLWEVFKEQNLTGINPYKNESDVYRHFVNWGNKQSFRKKIASKDKIEKEITPLSYDKQKLEEKRKTFNPIRE